MAADAENLTVVNNADEGRFETVVAGQLAVAEYVLAPGQIVFTHTEVPESLRGRGVANQLARAALDHARDAGLQVVPRCPFIRAYIQRHPEYQPLVAPHQGR
ncbi:MAG TPA: GNAT family N-acetyltransferase [Roseiflexaceae bacterium]|nr:GNAT family N-acetyltransferase [Roseiflexaceae bacterium]